MSSPSTLTVSSQDPSTLPSAPHPWPSAVKARERPPRGSEPRTRQDRTILPQVWTTRPVGSARVHVNTPFQVIPKHS